MKGFSACYWRGYHVGMNSLDPPHNLCKADKLRDLATRVCDQEHMRKQKKADGRCGMIGIFALALSPTLGSGKLCAIFLQAGTLANPSLGQGALCGRARRASGGTHYRSVILLAKITAGQRSQCAFIRSQIDRVFAVTSSKRGHERRVVRVRRNCQERNWPCAF